MAVKFYTAGGGITSEGLTAVDAWYADKLLACQTSLISDLMRATDYGEALGIDLEEVENLYAPHEDDSSCDDMQEIYEWWLVSDWLAEQLKKVGEPVLFHDYGTWWGRTTTGQSALIDTVLVDLAARYGVIDIGT